MTPNDLIHPVWEQQPFEGDASHTRFLTYRNLGPTRSLLGAYEFYCYSKEAAEENQHVKDIVKAKKSYKKLNIPGSWIADSSNNLWEFRANQWDINILSVAGREVIDNFYKSLAVHTRQLLEVMQEGKLLPRSYQELAEGLALIGSFITPEAVAAWRDFAGIYRPELQSNVSSHVETGTKASTIHNTTTNDGNVTTE
jgi:hypothetical protein